MNFTVLLFELRDFQWADVEHAFTELPCLILDVHVLSRHWGSEGGVEEELVWGLFSVHVEL